MIICPAQFFTHWLMSLFFHHDDHGCFFTKNIIYIYDISFLRRYTALFSCSPVVDETGSRIEKESGRKEEGFV